MILWYLPRYLNIQKKSEFEYLNSRKKGGDGEKEQAYSGSHVV